MSKRKSLENRKKIKVKGGHPEGHKNKKDVKNYPKLCGSVSVSELVGDLSKSVDSVIGTRSEWINRLVRWYRQRMGVRPKKSFPWIGASNIQLPTIDKAIKKIMPSYMNLSFPPGLIAKFEVNAMTKMSKQVYEEAEYNEALLDDLVRNRMENSFKKVFRLVDKELERGHALMKCTYQYKKRKREFTVNLEEDLNESQKGLIANNLEEFLQSEKKIIELFLLLLDQKGAVLNMSIPSDRDEMFKNLKKFRTTTDTEKEEYVFNLDVVEAHAPMWQVVNPENFIVSGDINDLQNAESVTHILYYTENDLRSLAEGGVIDETVTMEVIKNNTSKLNKSTSQGKDRVPSSLKATQDQYQGSYADNGGDDSNLIELRENYFVALDESGNQRKYVMLFSPLYLEEPLSFRELPYDDGKWPFVKFETEESNDGWLSSRGIPQVLDYLATTIDTMHNQKIDRMTIFNAPMMKFIPGQVNPANVRYVPGQFIPTKDINSIQPITFPTNSQTSYIEEERELRSQVEDYLPFVDFSLTDPQNGASKSRTFGEVMAAKQDKADRFSLDAKCFMGSYNELLEMTWSRWMQ